MATSTTTNKFRYVANRAGRARHSVRAAACNRFSERRARSDAPYHVTEFPCHDTRPGSNARLGQDTISRPAGVVVDFAIARTRAVQYPLPVFTPLIRQFR